MIYIVAGGAKENIPDLKEISINNPESIWIGVDAGALLLLSNGIKPMCAIGDFDSISEEEFSTLSGVKVFRAPAEKDESDLELAIRWVISNYDDPITVLGATGNRLDHELINILMLTEIVQSRECWIKDTKNEITVLHSGKTEFNKSDLKYISFISLDKKLENVCLSGVKYPLCDAVILRNSSLGLSNEIVSETCTISFQKGICLVVRSSD